MTDFFRTFRGRLLLILAFLLVATLGVQYYLNLRTQNENNNLRAMQEKALVAGFSLGVNSISSNEYLEISVNREGQTFFDEDLRQRIKDIIIIDKDWKVTDSLNSPEYQPKIGPDNETEYLNLMDIQNLPPLMEDKNRLGEDFDKFPNTKFVQTDETEGEAHAIPVETSLGRYYVMVILKSDKKETASRAARPLIYNLGILLLSTVITIFLVWRFTRPIANLSDAARRVAEGYLSVRVENIGRNDEIGQLTARFNEMIAELEKSRKLNEQLQQAEKSAVVGRLASAIAHEIRNPLNYINLTLDFLRAKFRPEDAEKNAIFEKLTAQLKEEVGRINNQITDFLNYSRPAKTNLQPLEAGEVVADSLRIIEAQAEEQNIKINLAAGENVPRILGDSEYLRSVFNNLFINAAQAMEKNGGNLNVIISPTANFVKIEISDTGEGISAENLSKIFEPYFSTKETGTGLGLAIVKKIVDDHNGTIEAESTLGGGTKFTVSLPSV